MILVGIKIVTQYHSHTQTCF